MNVGTKVEVRLSKSRRLSGTIARMNGDKTCDVDLDNGEQEKEVPMVLIRSIEEAQPKEGIAAVLSKSETSENKISLSNDVGLSIGDRVEAKFRGRGSRYYKGTVKNVIDGDKYDIDYDDGDRDRNLSAEHIRKLDGSVGVLPKRMGGVSRTKKGVATISADAAKESAVATAKPTDDSAPSQPVFSKGQRVKARYRGRGKRWYKGTISECFESKNEYSIHYDDGDRDRRLSAEFIRPIDNTSEVLQDNTTAADVRVINNSGKMVMALPNEEENREQPISTANDDETNQLEEATAELVESEGKENIVSAPNDISNIVVAPDAVDGDVSFVVDSGHETRKESSTKDDDAPGDRTESQDEQSAAKVSSGKGNRLYRGKVVRVKTIRLYEIEYPDSTTDKNIPFKALCLPQGLNESDIKVGTCVDVLSWQDRFAAVL